MKPVTVALLTLALSATPLLAANPSMRAAPAPSPAADIDTETALNHTQLQEDQRQNITLHALALLNTGYRYGGSHPGKGLDCSGLIHYIFHSATGLRLPRTAAAIAAVARRVHPTSLQPGDLVFFNTLGRHLSHVGIYIGRGRFLHAPRTGAYVRVDHLNNRYYAKRFEGGRTLFNG